MVVNEGATAIGIKLLGQAAPLDGRLERIEQSVSIGARIVSGIGDQPGMVIEQHAEVSRMGLSVDREPGSW